MCSDTNPGVANGEGLLEGVVGVASHEVLQQELGVGEVRSVILERLSVGSHECLLEVSSEPYPLLHVLAAEQVLSLLDELIGAHLHVLVEEVAAEDLLAIAVVQDVGGHEQEPEGGLGNELQVLVVEEDVIVVEEQELHSLLSDNVLTAEIDAKIRYFL